MQTIRSCYVVGHGAMYEKMDTRFTLFIVFIIAHDCPGQPWSQRLLSQYDGKTFKDILEIYKLWEVIKQILKNVKRDTWYLQRLIYVKSRSASYP